jgi:hypothetical protein
MDDASAGHGSARLPWPAERPEFEVHMITCNEEALQSRVPEGVLGVATFVVDGPGTVASSENLSQCAAGCHWSSTLGRPGLYSLPRRAVGGWPTLCRGVCYESLASESR